ncbi:phosphocholine cytidylyltransferase family protein [Azonexus sp.]|jgi:choline kinase|uniref:phosphocholine cytidylyltransferase family protein n=1 Tax=Azonexus sp. TaxID=1872668 RepID=UPI002839F39E|nr:phosphocholine cytidylyltransferase family protein [Azonexus sp.]MDR1995198.1 phosphocholine cytidylyltransferase family protein [Azonexus sp.]
MHDKTHMPPSTRPFGALILAAGLGSRLGSNTTAKPKCLVPVSHTPILQRMLDSLVAEGVSSVIIAVGYLSEAIRDFVGERYPRLDVRFVANPDYAATGSVYSLHLAMQEFPLGQDLLIIEGDVVLAPKLLSSLLRTGRQSADAATLLARYEPCLSGTFALVDQGRVSAWLHETVRTADFPLTQSYKTVNLTYVRQLKAFIALDQAVRHVIEKNGPHTPLEYAMQHMIAKGIQIDAIETGAHPWFEVDTPEDLAIANRLFPPLH